jgi:hypothetical protein
LQNLAHHGRLPAARAVRPETRRREKSRLEAPAISRATTTTTLAREDLLYEFKAGSPRSPLSAAGWQGPRAAVLAAAPPLHHALDSSTRIVRNDGAVPLWRTVAANCASMGSFTELTLAFTFSPNTPIAIIGAFGEWRVPDEDWRSAKPAPILPALPDDLRERAEMGDFYAVDSLTDLAPLEEAAVWRELMAWSPNAYFPGTPSTTLRWDPYGERWSLTTRALPKADGLSVQSLIRSLGRWAVNGTPARPWFAGYILDEYSPRPVLIWSVAKAPFRFEGDFAQP